MKEVDLISEVTGKVWKILVNPGEQVSEDDTVLIVESMKMEIPVVASEDGELIELTIKEGDPVEDGQVVGKIRKNG